MVDDNNGRSTDFILVSNPGIDTVNVAIDTTPDVARLEVFLPEADEVFLGDQNSFADGLQQGSGRVVTSDVLIGSERYLELEVVAPDGTDHFHAPDPRRGAERSAGVFRHAAGQPLPHFPGADGEQFAAADHGRVRPPRPRDRPVRRLGRHARPAAHERRESANRSGAARRESKSRARARCDEQRTECRPQTSTWRTSWSKTKSASDSESTIDELAPSPEPLVPLRGSHRWVVPLAGFALAASAGGWSQRVNQAARTMPMSAHWQRLAPGGDDVTGRSNRTLNHS